jgi:hypothetical protein
VKSFLAELKKRNSLLYWFGLYNLTVAILCIILMQVDSQQILGVSRWLKPMKFFFSVWIMVWTMAWLLYYLNYEKSTKTISWIITVSMFIENFIIFVQSLRGQRSHFNVHDPTNALLFAIMGIVIVVFSFAVIYIAWLFFRQKEFSISQSYLWGIRLGLIFFIIFSFEAGFMLSHMAHTVGAPDGGPGLPVTNWSKQFGDLRIAHFFGLHSLQILPLAGYFIFRKPVSISIFAMIYFLLVTTTLVIALMGLPLL